MPSLRGRCTGAAWLSSARVVRCWVKSRNERNPHRLLPSGYAGHSGETAGDMPEEGGDDVRPHGPYIPGYTRATMVGTEGRNTARWSQSQKADLSSDWSLQLDSTKSESLVIAYQHAAVNTFPGLVHTARQATKAGSTRSRCADPQGR